MNISNKFFHPKLVAPFAGLLVGVCVIQVCVRIPILRNAYAALHEKTFIILAAATLIAFVLQLMKKNEPISPNPALQQAQFSLSPFLSSTLLWILGFLILLPSVFSAWKTGVAEGTLLGLFPDTDGPGYYKSAKQLLYWGQYKTFADRRPISSVLMASRMYLAGHSFTGMIWIQGFFLGWCCLLAARTVWKRLGAPAAIFFFALLVALSSEHIPNYKTEATGLSLGAIAFALLLESAAVRSRRLFACGMLALTVALNARAGAFFVLPSLLVWPLSLPEEKWKIKFKWLGLGLAGILLGFAIQGSLTLINTGKISLGQGNFNCMLYNMARGLPGHTPTYLLPQEEKKKPYSLCIKLIKKNPENLLKAAKIKMVRYFDKTGEILHQHASFRLGSSADLALYSLLFLAGGWFLWRQRKTLPAGMAFFALLGLVASGTVLGKVALNRVILTTFPFLAIIPAMGIAQLTRRSSFNDAKDFDSLPIATIGTIILAIYFGAVIAHQVDGTAKAATRYLDKHGTMIARMQSDMPWWRIVPDDYEGGTYYPNLRISDYRRLISTKTINKRLAFHTEVPLANNLQPGDSIIMAYPVNDLFPNRLEPHMFIVGKTKNLIKGLKDRPQLVAIKGRYEPLVGPSNRTKVHFYVVDSEVRPLKFL